MVITLCYYFVCYEVEVFIYYVDTPYEDLLFVGSILILEVWNIIEEKTADKILDKNIFRFIF